jgi:hypothetical protein
LFAPAPAAYNCFICYRNDRKVPNPLSFSTAELLYNPQNRKNNKKIKKFAMCEVTPNLPISEIFKGRTWYKGCAI